MVDRKLILAPGMIVLVKDKFYDKMLIPMFVIYKDDELCLIDNRDGDIMKVNLFDEKLRQYRYEIKKILVIKDTEPYASELNLEEADSMIETYITTRTNFINKLTELCNKFDINLKAKNNNIVFHNKNTVYDEFFEQNKDTKEFKRVFKYD